MQNFNTLPPLPLPDVESAEINIVPADNVNDMTPMTLAGRIARDMGQPPDPNNLNEWLSNYIEFPVRASVGALIKGGYTPITSSANYENVEGNYGGPAHIGFFVTDVESRELMKTLQAAIDTVKKTDVYSNAQFAVVEVPDKRMAEGTMVFLELGLLPETTAGQVANAFNAVTAVALNQ